MARSNLLSGLYIKRVHGICRRFRANVNKYSKTGEHKKFLH